MPNQHRYKKEIELICKESHRTAEEIFKKLKKDYFFLGIGTVYRNLQELVDDDVLMKTAWLVDKVIFEKKKEAHGHIVCWKSSMIIDVPISGISFDDIDLPDGFNLENINVVFDGHFVEQWSSCKWIAEFTDKTNKLHKN